MEGLDKNILNLILGHVETKDDLLDCTLVCKRWTHISRKQIIQQFYKDDDDPYIQLSLEFKDLTMLPVEIGCLTNLMRLELGYNQLTTLPVEIGRLTNLRMLFLEHNHLTTLPVEIGCLTNLSMLWVQNNNLTTLPAEIGCLTDLEVLNVKCNQLSILPATLINIDRLRKDPNVTFIQKRKLK